MCVPGVYATLAKRRENIPNTRKQKDLQMNNGLVALFHVEEYKQFGATATEAQGDEAGEASSEDHRLVYMHHTTKIF